MCRSIVRIDAAQFLDPSQCARRDQMDRREVEERAGRRHSGEAADVDGDVGVDPIAEHGVRLGAIERGDRRRLCEST